MGPKWANEKLVIILSEGSMQSDWLQNQVSAALKQETKAQATILFPIRLDATITDAEAPWAAELGRNRTVYDFSQWQTEEAYKQAFELLLRELEATDGGAI
jgi:hypothetical protein